MSSLTEQLQSNRARAAGEAESLLLRAKSENRSTLSELEQKRLDGHLADLRAIDRRLAELEDDEQRASGIPPNLAALGTGRRGTPPGSGRVNCRPGSEVMPIDFNLEQLREAHGKVLRQEPCLLETRAGNTASPLLPAELYPLPTFPIHESRIADRLPAFALDAPSLEYIQVNSVTGTAGVVAEGTAKPEIVLNTTKIIATVSKIAATLGLTWESIQDADAFTSSATTDFSGKSLIRRTRRFWGG